MELDHTHILGKNEDDTTELTKQRFLQCRGRMLIDPVGTLSEQLLHVIDRNDVVYFNMSDLDYPIPINPLFNVPIDDRPDATDMLKDMFLSLWQYDDFPATRVIDCLYNCIAALLDYPDGTIVDIKYMLLDKTFRDRVVPYIQNPVIKSYWEDEFGSLKDKDKAELISSTRANIHQLVADPRLSNIFGLPKPRLDFADIIPKEKTVIVNLSGVGRNKVKLVGSMLIAMAVNSAGAKPFHIFALKAQKYTDSVLIDILDAGRSKNLSITLVHRYLGELSDRLQDAVLGGVGEQVLFRLGAKDAAVFEKQWEFSNSRASLVSELAPHHYREITQTTVRMALPEDPLLNYLPVEKNLLRKRNTITLSRRLYGTKRSKIEGYLLRKRNAGQHTAVRKDNWVGF